MAEGFLGRWSRRKVAAKEGRQVDEPPQAEPQTSALSLSRPAATGEAGNLAPRGGQQAAVAPSSPGAEAAAVPPPGEPPPTLNDVRALTRDSDFSRFVRPDVAPQVKNAALKKLFADPHFNVMDGLDVYIDDYSKPDPIPPSMLRSLASSKFLGLFEDEEKRKAAQSPHSPADVPTSGAPAAPGSQTVAQSAPAVESPAAVPPRDPTHADPDLRLQPDDAPGPEGPGQGPG